MRGPRPTRPRSRSSRRRKRPPRRRFREAARSWSRSPTRSPRPSRASTRPTRSRRSSRTCTRPLVTTDPQGNLAPALCEKWTFEDNGLAVRLRLRPGVVFSDGAPLTAAAVKASLERSIRLSRDQMPAAFVAIRGVAEYLDGKTEGVAGISAPSDREIVIRLADPLPIFPSLLTDPRTAIVAAQASGGPPLGTGPFQVTLHTPDRVVLERNPRLREGARRASTGSSSGPRSRPPRSRRACAPASSTSRATCSRRTSRRSSASRGSARASSRRPRRTRTSPSSTRRAPAGSNAALRHALADAVADAGPRLGSARPLRAARHGPDPARDPRPRRGTPAAALLAREGRRDDPLRRACRSPVRLRAAVHPILLDQYAALTEALFRIWAELGVEVEIATKTMPEFIESWHANEGVDVMLGRWIADYDDPTTSRSPSSTRATGRLRALLLLARDRPDPRGGPRRERGRPPARRSTASSSTLLLDPAILVPLFHDVDYRIAGPPRPGPPASQRGSVRQLRRARKGGAGGGSGGTAGRRAEGSSTCRSRASSGTSIPRSCETRSRARSLPSLFETLTRAIDGTRIVPWLASEVLTENDGKRYRFRLRPGVRFHDGRRLTARDVRYSWERLLADAEREPLAAVAHPRRPADHRRRDRRPRGLPHRLADGVLHRPREARLLLSGASSPTRRRRSCRREPAHRRDRGGGRASGPAPSGSSASSPGGGSSSSATRTYWREGYPRSEGIVFRFGVSPEEIRSEFLAGRFSIASDLLPADAEAFRHDPRFASGYREDPRLATYYVDFQLPPRPAPGRGAAPQPRAAPSTSADSSDARSEGSPSRRTASSRRAFSATRRQARLGTASRGPRLHRTARSKRRCRGRPSS